MKHGGRIYMKTQPQAFLNLPGKFSWLIPQSEVGKRRERMLSEIMTLVIKVNGAVQKHNFQAPATGNFQSSSVSAPLYILSLFKFAM